MPLLVHYIVIDAHDLLGLARFWSEVLDWRILSERQPSRHRHDSRLRHGIYDPRGRLTSTTGLYVLAPVAVVRHIGYRRDVDQETMLGALCAYLLFFLVVAVGKVVSAWRPRGWRPAEEPEQATVRSREVTCLTDLAPTSWRPRLHPGYQSSMRASRPSGSALNRSRQ
jgi:hypothetical protein